MSIINTETLTALWNEAQQQPEWATTQLWEHIFNRIVFNNHPWIVSSQQPPTRQDGDLRRVDLVVKRVTSGITLTLLFMEAKRGHPSPSDVALVEMQAYTAACAYAVEMNSVNPIWAMTCVGSQARLWIFDWDQPFLTPFFPDTHGNGELSEYIEISRQGTDLLERLEYIKANPIPPVHLLHESSPRPTNATLPNDWPDDEVKLRDSQHS
ncbi:hypothetical protein F5B22DRAFT_302782 [Xylaria bambusicola]|uniref:uncharacterized protein n=1 Tax=Xylaria bambusicola TaxID=326684 RepID=UPI002008BD6F|nr:uncharacterized protein F5B22DRAFT_302782 [Xylaria bambusicola]KAI0512703.1 hypothetical protein F5B22DRAFT_302782 [Xylaria bambusicola]